MLLNNLEKRGTAWDLSLIMANAHLSETSAAALADGICPWSEWDGRNRQ